MDLVGARFGDDVHEPARCAPELGVRPFAHHHYFPDRIAVERERGPLAAALLPEERVVEVRSVHGDVVVDAPLARHRQLVTVRSLYDRDVWGQEREVQIVAPVVGQTLDRLYRDTLRRLGL